MINSDNELGTSLRQTRTAFIVNFLEDSSGFQSKLDYHRQHNRCSKTSTLTHRCVCVCVCVFNDSNMELIMYTNNCPQTTTDKAEIQLNQQPTGVLSTVKNITR